MGFIENHSVSQSVFNTSPEHIFIKTVEDERRKGFLEIVILRCMDTNDARCLTNPKAFPRFPQIEETVIAKFLQTRKQGPQPPVRLGFITQYLQKSPKLGLRHLVKGHIRIAPP